MMNSNLIWHLTHKWEIFMYRTESHSSGICVQNIRWSHVMVLILGNYCKLCENKFNFLLNKILLSTAHIEIEKTIWFYNQIFCLPYNFCYWLQINMNLYQRKCRFGLLYDNPLFLLLLFFFQKIPKPCHICFPLLEIRQMCSANGRQCKTWNLLAPNVGWINKCMYSMWAQKRHLSYISVEFIRTAIIWIYTEIWSQAHPTGIYTETNDNV